MAPPKFFCCMRRKPMPAATRPFFGSFCKQLRESPLRFIQPVRIQRRKGRALGRRARNAGIHLRQLAIRSSSDCWRLQYPADAPSDTGATPPPRPDWPSPRSAPGAAPPAHPDPADAPRECEFPRPGSWRRRSACVPSATAKRASPGLRSASARMPAMAAALPVEVANSV